MWPTVQGPLFRYDMIFIFEGDLSYQQTLFVITFHFLVFQLQASIGYDMAPNKINTCRENTLRFSSPAWYCEPADDSQIHCK